MVSASNLLAFIVVASIIIAIPGPSVLFSVGRALAWGKKAAILSVLGNAAGVAVQIVAVALGVGALIRAIPALYFSIQIVGALIVLALGIQAIVTHKSHGEEGEPAPAPRGRRQFVESIGVGITNPKTLVFFIASLPAFVSPEGSVVLQMLVLGAIFLIIGITGDSIWALGAGYAREWFAKSPARLVGVRVGGGLALSGLGLYMLWEALH